jgi:hypothetical protein
MGTTKRYGVIVGSRSVLTVIADSEAEARRKASRQLNKPGRHRIRERWVKEGRRVRSKSE